MVDARSNRKYQDEGYSGADLDEVCQDGSMSTNLMTWAWSKSLEQPVVCRIDPTMSRPRTQKIETEKFSGLASAGLQALLLSYIIGFWGSSLHTNAHQEPQVPMLWGKKTEKEVDSLFHAMPVSSCRSRVGKGTGAISGKVFFILLVWFRMPFFPIFFLLVSFTNYKVGPSEGTGTVLYLRGRSSGEFLLE